MKKIYILYISIIISQNIFSQIIAPEADFVIPTDYVNSDSIGVDSIFGFYTPGYNGWTEHSMLEASYLDQTGLTFTWKMYNNETHEFDTIIPGGDIYFEYNIDSSKSMLYTKLAGGFEVNILKESVIDTIFHAWVYQNYLTVDIEIESTCDYTLLSGIEGGNSYYYYDLVDHTRIELENGLEIEWSAEPETEATLRPYTSLRLTPPHYDDTEFSVHVIDSFNYEKEDDMYVLARATKAEFYASINMEVLTDTVIKSNQDYIVEAPFKVQFVDSAKNVATYEWKFFNDLDKNWNGKDTLLGISDQNPPILPEIDDDSILYYRPGNYDVVLIVVGPQYSIDDEEFACVDSLYKFEYINVDSSKVNIPLPNVFTPNGANPVFKIKQEGNPEFDTKSLANFEIYIYNRWGKKVYEYSDNSGDWEGWNGEIKGEGRLVEPGVYFYVLKAVGWDGRLWEAKDFVHVFYPK